MQKSFIAIALALTLTSAFAAYTASNYVTAPVPVAADGDTSFTNMSTLYLASITPGNLYLLAGNITVNPANQSSNNWNLFYRKLNNVTLAGIQNNTASIVAPLVLFFLNNYAVGFGIDSTSGASNLWAYQIPLTSGTAGPGRLQLSNNTNPNFTVTAVGSAQIRNAVYVAYLAANLTVNITSFTVGATAPGTPFTLSNTFDTPYSLSLIWGEALSSNQLFAVWSENGVLKDTVIDVWKRIVATPTVVPGYNKNNQAFCNAFATDETLYGEICLGIDAASGNILYWVRTTANGTLIQIANYTVDTSFLTDFVPYGPYLAVFFLDRTAATGFSYAYELWDLDIFKTTSAQPRKQYLIIDSNSAQIPFKVVSGGYYTLLFNKPQFFNGILGTITNVQVGLVLESSYLASGLGFLLTTVAGLLLF